MAGLLDDPTGYVGGLLGDAWKRFRGVDPQTGQTDYFNRGGVAGLLGMPAWYEQSPLDIAMGFAGSTTPAVKGIAGALAKPQGIRAYHGSPHDFDRFDLSKIGTGEGAQAYGHGLYFAENEGVARSYRDALSRPELLLNGEPLKAPDWKALVKSGEMQKMPISAQVDLSARDMLSSVKHDPARWTLDDAIADQALNARILANKSSPGEADYWRDVSKRIEELGKDLRVKDGRMYEVQINADPERFLDWDKPMRPDVKSVLDSGLRKKFDWGDSGSESFWKNAGNAGEAYTRAERALNPSEVTATFREAGIPGIRYFDQGSRGAANVNDLRGTVSMWERAAKKTPDDPYAKQMLDQARSELAEAEGGLSRNYVVFDDKLIDILRKYGLLGPMAGAATAGAVGDY